MPYSRIIKIWWPLAASWLLMGAELPFISAVIARLPDPAVHLAAYGGVVFPLALIIESPIIMLLPASTALSKDWGSYRKVWRFMMVTSAVLTVLHILVAFTPLYDVVVVGIMKPPQEIIEPARIGLMIMTPWTWAIAYRRFNQGVLIRNGYSNSVGVGTVVRLVTDAVVLGVGYFLGGIPGIVVGTAAVAAGVVFEAIYVGIVVRPVIERKLKPAPAIEMPLTLRSFLQFYIPLAMTSLLLLITQPIGSAAISRMPQALSSLAVWPVVTGLIFMLRGLGMAFNEVVVTLLDETGSVKSLRRFAVWLSASTTLVLLLLAATPLSNFWFAKVSALPEDLVSLARLGLWVGLLMPALNVYQSWYQGTIVFGRRTRGITESVVLFLVSSILILTAGVVWGGVPGLFVGLASFTISSLLQNAWLWYRSRPVLASLEQRDLVKTGAVEVFKATTD